jgi:hypothetical protein
MAVGPHEVSVEQANGIDLIAPHRLAVAVERDADDRDIRMSYAGRELLRVDPGGAILNEAKV